VNRYSPLLRVCKARPVGPELSLGTETMPCLDESDQKGNPDGTQLGNLSQKLMGWMLPAFPQQLPPCVAPDLQQIEETLRFHQIQETPASKGVKGSCTYQFFCRQAKAGRCLGNQWPLAR
jgi:hypothetical protein